MIRRPPRSTLFPTRRSSDLRGLKRTWWGVTGAVLLILAAPYVVRYFGRGIAPPASGVSLELWLSWQAALAVTAMRSEEHTSELQSRLHLVCRLLLEKKKKQNTLV